LHSIPFFIILHFLPLFSFSISRPPSPFSFFALPFFATFFHYLFTQRRDANIASFYCRIKSSQMERMWGRRPQA